MLRVGLTGGLAAGKSLVADMLSEMGARVMQADLVARDLMSPGQPVYHDVVRHFGREILAEDGSINRSKLARMVFGTGRIRELNEIVHPAVVQKQEQWMAGLEASEPQVVAIVEAALIFEAGLPRRFDKLIVVTAPEDLRIERFVQRHLPADGSSGAQAAELRAEARRRLAAQIPEAQKIAAADYVIDNSGSVSATRRQVERVFRHLERLAIHNADAHG